MLEMLLSPRKAERHPWEMFFVGLVYASAAFFLVRLLFAGDAGNSKFTGWILVLFMVILSMPFFYYIIKNEEEKDKEYSGFFRILKEHNRALMTLLWLFLGFVVALSFFYIVYGPELFNAQIGTYCQINQPGNPESCISQYQTGMVRTTGFMTSKERIFAIFANNIYVLIYTLGFSLIFGAGAIFILAWNASVIAAAIGIFSKSELNQLPLGIARYMIHGIPEIAAYFIAALAGGIVGIAIIRHDTQTEKFWSILQDSLNLVIVAIVILFLAALVEVFITPRLF